tara:strand:+ start:1185 stop:2021 length:837 start_codon:yes stop_codon:yes gene_type:complete
MVDAVSLALMGVSALTSLTGAGMSFGQAAKQRKAQEKAERESQALMQQARDRMQTRFFEQLRLPTEAYERQFRENTAQQKQALQALQESDPRTLAAGVGKVAAAGVAGNQALQEQMSRELFELQKLKAEEQRAINEELVGMDVGEAASQNLMARDANAAANQALQSGVLGVGQATKTASGLIKDFTMNKDDRQASRAFDKLNDAQKKILGIENMTRDDFINKFSGKVNNKMFKDDELFNYLNNFLNPSVVDSLGTSGVALPPLPGITADVLTTPIVTS